MVANLVQELACCSYWMVPKQEKNTDCENGNPQQAYKDPPLQTRQHEALYLMIERPFHRTSAGASLSCERRGRRVLSYVVQLSMTTRYIVARKLAFHPFVQCLDHSRRTMLSPGATECDGECGGFGLEHGRRRMLYQTSEILEHILR